MLNKNSFNPDFRPVAFGRYIKAIRVQKGIDLQTVSEEIRVSLHQLYLIESEDHDELPDGEFVKRVLRAYAGFIGIDADDIIDRYEINRSAYFSGNRASSRKKLPDKKLLVRIFIGLLIGVGIGVVATGAYYGWSALAVNEAKKEYASPEKAIAAPSADHPESNRLVLTIDAVEETWIKINIDGEESLEYLLSPKDHVELEADSHYHMLIGNAGGLKMKLNGEPVDIGGKSGEVVTLELPGTQKK